MTKIVAAALKRGKVIFSAPPPARHHTLIHEIDQLFGSKHRVFGPAEQGFIGDDGNFYGRKAAKVIAGEAEQIGVTDSEDLFSEDLW